MKRTKLGTDMASRIYLVGTQVFKNAPDATEYAYQARQKWIKVYQHPLKKPLNKNRIPLIPLFLMDYLDNQLEYIATYRQNGTSTLYYAVFKSKGMLDAISF